MQKQPQRVKGLPLGHRASKKEVGLDGWFVCLHTLPSPWHCLSPDPRRTLTVSLFTPDTAEAQKPSSVPTWRLKKCPPGRPPHALVGRRGGGRVYPEGILWSQLTQSPCSVSDIIPGAFCM